MKLTEDDDVFLMTGFYLNDAVLCPVSTHATAVAGGNMTAERIEQAEAPWLAWLPDTDQPKEVVASFAERGELDGKVAVFAAVADKDDLENDVLPALEKAGVEPVETGISDAPPNDPVATQNAVRTIAERFKAAGADTVLAVGASGANWPTSMADDTSYRPKLLFLDITAPRAFATSDATTDTSILDGSLSGGGYGPDQARYEEPEMQKCLAILEDAGIETPAPDEFDAGGSLQPAVPGRLPGLPRHGAPAGVARGGGREPQLRHPRGGPGRPGARRPGRSDRAHLRPAAGRRREPVGVLLRLGRRGPGLRARGRMSAS